MSVTDSLDSVFESSTEHDTRHSYEYLNNVQNAENNVIDTRHDDEITTTDSHINNDINLKLHKRRLNQRFGKRYCSLSERYLATKDGITDKVRTHSVEEYDELLAKHKIFKSVSKTESLRRRFSTTDHLDEVLLQLKQHNGEEQKSKHKLNHTFPVFEEQETFQEIIDSQAQHYKDVKLYNDVEYELDETVAVIERIGSQSDDWRKSTLKLTEADKTNFIIKSAFEMDSLNSRHSSATSESRLKKPFAYKFSLKQKKRKQNLKSSNQNTTECKSLAVTKTPKKRPFIWKRFKLIQLIFRSFRRKPSKRKTFMTVEVELLAEDDPFLNGNTAGNIVKIADENPEDIAKMTDDSAANANVVKKADDSAGNVVDMTAGNPLSPSDQKKFNDNQINTTTTHNVTNEITIHTSASSIETEEPFVTEDTGEMITTQQQQQAVSVEAVNMEIIGIKGCSESKDPNENVKETNGTIELKLNVLNNVLNCEVEKVTAENPSMVDSIEDETKGNASMVEEIKEKTQGNENYAQHDESLVNEDVFYQNDGTEMETINDIGSMEVDSTINMTSDGSHFDDTIDFHRPNISISSTYEAADMSMENIHDTDCNVEEGDENVSKLPEGGAEENENENNEEEKEIQKEMYSNEISSIKKQEETIEITDQNENGEINRADDCIIINDQFEANIDEIEDTNNVINQDPLAETMNETNENVGNEEFDQDQNINETSVVTEEGDEETGEIEQNTDSVSLINLANEEIDQSDYSTGSKQPLDSVSATIDSIAPIVVNRSSAETDTDDHVVSTFPEESSISKNGTITTAPNADDGPSPERNIDSHEVSALIEVSSVGNELLDSGSTTTSAAVEPSPEAELVPSLVEDTSIEKQLLDAGSTTTAPAIVQDELSPESNEVSSLVEDSPIGKPIEESSNKEKTKRSFYKKLFSRKSKKQNNNNNNNNNKVADENLLIVGDVNQNTVQVEEKQQEEIVISSKTNYDEGLTKEEIQQPNSSVSIENNIEIDPQIRNLGLSSPVQQSKSKNGKESSVEHPNDSNVNNKVDTSIVEVHQVEINGCIHVEMSHKNMDVIGEDIVINSSSNIDGKSIPEEKLKSKQNFVQRLMNRKNTMSKEEKKHNGDITPHVNITPNDIAKVSSTTNENDVIVTDDTNTEDLLDIDEVINNEYYRLSQISMDTPTPQQEMDLSSLLDFVSA